MRPNKINWLLKQAIQHRYGTQEKFMAALEQKARRPVSRGAISKSINCHNAPGGTLVPLIAKMLSKNAGELFPSELYHRRHNGSTP